MDPAFTNISDEVHVLHKRSIVTTRQTRPGMIVPLQSFPTFLRTLPHANKVDLCISIKYHGSSDVNDDLETAEYREITETIHGEKEIKTAGLKLFISSPAPKNLNLMHACARRSVLCE